MNIAELNNFTSALSNPIPHALKCIENGDLPDSEGKINQVGLCIRILEKERLPGAEGRYEHNSRFHENYGECPEGKECLERIRIYQEQIKFLKDAIVRGKKLIEKQSKQNLKKETEKAIQKATELAPRTQANPAIVELLEELAEQLNGKNLLEMAASILENRRLYKINLRKLDALREQGIENIPDFSELEGDSLGESIFKITGQQFTKHGWT